MRVKCDASMESQFDPSTPSTTGQESQLRRLRTLLKHYRAARAVYTLVAPQNYRRVWRQVLTAAGYDHEQWMRVVYYAEWKDFLQSLPAQSASALEVSPGVKTVWREIGFRSYTAVQYPEFDISAGRLTESFDVIIADQVFEHLRHPYRAARNIGAMLRPHGTFLIATPFLVKVHPFPQDFTRWTAEGLKAFLEDCGFTVEVHTWGNRRVTTANFNKWRAYGWKRDLNNESDFPVSVWAYARRTPSMHSATRRQFPQC
jgi:SAM-dependent methyltransferase